MAEKEQHNLSPEERELKVEQTKLVKVQTQKARVEIKKAKLEVERLQRIDDIEQLSDFNHRQYSFAAEVAKLSVKQAIDALTVWYREDPKEPVTIIFDSPGGSVFAGLALFDTIRHFRA